MKGLRGLERRWSHLQWRAFYSVAELARVGNVPAYRLLRLLRRCGITFLRSGRVFYVSLDEIRQKIPALWWSLRLVEHLRRRVSVRKHRPNDRSLRSPRAVRP